VCVYVSVSMSVCALSLTNNFLKELLDIFITSLALKMPWEAQRVARLFGLKLTLSKWMELVVRLVLCRVVFWEVLAGTENPRSRRSGEVTLLNATPSPSQWCLRYDGLVQELCESRGGHTGLSVLASLLVSVDVNIYWTVHRHWSQLVPNMSSDIWRH